MNQANVIAIIIVAIVAIGFAGMAWIFICDCIDARRFQKEREARHAAYLADKYGSK